MIRATKLPFDLAAGDRCKRRILNLLDEADEEVSDNFEKISIGHSNGFTDWSSHSC